MNIICCANQDQPRTSAAECPILPDGIKTKFPGCGSWAQAFWKWETKGSEFIWVLCVSSSISQSIILTTGPKARNGKTKLASCRAELPRAESPFLAAGPCTSSTRLSPQPETNFMSERCKCIANALQIRFGVLCDCPEFKSLVGSIESPKLFFWNFHSVPHGSAWFCVKWFQIWGCGHLLSLILCSSRLCKLFAREPLLVAMAEPWTCPKLLHLDTGGGRQNCTVHLVH